MSVQVMTGPATARGISNRRLRDDYWHLLCHRTELPQAGDFVKLQWLNEEVVLSNDADAATWAEVGNRLEHGASNLGVAASIAAYEQGGPWLTEVLSYLDGNRRLLGELLADQLPDIGYTAPEGTYLAWLDCRALDLGDHPAAFFLERAGVALTDGPLCGRVGAGFARYTFATPRPVMEQTVAQMAEALRRR